jgi:hypothetical protein
MCVPLFVGLGRVERSFKGHVITRISFIEGSGRVEGLRVMPLPFSVLVPIYTTSYGPFIDLSPMFKGLRHL